MSQSVKSIFTCLTISFTLAQHNLIALTPIALIPPWKSLAKVNFHYHLTMEISIIKVCQKLRWIKYEQEEPNSLLVSLMNGKSQLLGPWILHVLSLLLFQNVECKWIHSKVVWQCLNVLPHGIPLIGAVFLISIVTTIICEITHVIVTDTSTSLGASEGVGGGTIISWWRQSTVL